jgi:adenine-specific DNA-methyltransferase
LQESYLGKVKMIYIDPPYNTGKDFVYRDNFTQNTQEYFLQSQQKDDEGNRLESNTDSNGRFHSDWLSMMYPRLRLARNLLRDDGVIFISIDDNEVHNLRKVCDEIFGEDNFVAQIIWKKRSTPPNDKAMAAQHDYIVSFAKKMTNESVNLRPRTDKQIARYKNPDSHPKGPWTAGDLMANVKGGRYVESLYYPITNPRTGKQHYPSSSGNWRYSKSTVDKLLENNEIYFGNDDCGRPKLKRFLKDVKSGITWTTLWDFAPYNATGSQEMQTILGNLNVFESPKPIGLLQAILVAGCCPDGIVLDFFAGSSTTAHAVMKLNAEDNGNRKFIMVQLPELCPPKSEAAKAGYETIAEISKERIRRAGKKIKEELDEEQAKRLDTGFRVLKVDSSNMQDVYYRPNEICAETLGSQISNIKEKRTDEDLLFQVMVDWGLELTLPICREYFEMESKGTIEQVPLYFVAENSLVACFNKKGLINEKLIRHLAGYKPLRVVFRDDGFKNDSTKINAEQIFKQMSPETELKVL